MLRPDAVCCPELYRDMNITFLQGHEDHDVTNFNLLFREVADSTVTPQDDMKIKFMLLPMPIYLLFILIRILIIQYRSCMSGQHTAPVGNITIPYGCSHPLSIITTNPTNPTGWIQ